MSAKIPGVKDVGGAKINHTVLVVFVECSDTSEFSASFNAGVPRVKDFLDQVHVWTIAQTSSIVAVLTEESNRKASEQFKTWFVVNEHRVM